MVVLVPLLICVWTRRGGGDVRGTSSGGDVGPLGGHVEMVCASETGKKKCGTTLSLGM